MKLSGIIGQDNVVDLLKQAFANGRFAQSYIFSGPDGVGKRSTAVAFAKLLNCAGMPGNAEHLDACDECIPCHKIEQYNHPDVEIIAPEEGKKSIGIKQIQGLQKRVALKSMEGSKKVYIIDNADSMTRDASNCLLKTLEEPNEDVVIMLIVRNLYSMLPTVRSRCQVLKFKVIPVDVIEKVLVEEEGMAGNRAAFIAELSQGRLGVARQYAGEDMEKVLEFAQQVVEESGMADRKYPDYENVFGITDKLYRNRGDVSQFLNCLLVSLRRVFVANPVAEMKARIDAVLNTQRLIARNVNAQAALNDMLIKLYTVK